MNTHVAKKVESMLTDRLGIDKENFSLANLDSLQVINLIVELENEFSIQIEISDITVENWSSFSALVEYVQSKT